MKGTQREYAVMKALRRLDYRCGRVSASGQRKSEDAKANGLPCDVIGYARRPQWPHVWVESGGVGKRIKAALAAMMAEPLPPGTIAVVARCVRRRWIYYTVGARAKSLEALLKP